MEDFDPEKLINSSPEPVSLDGTRTIINQMYYCVCKIYNNGEGSGFFTKIPFKSKMLPVLITNNHVINEIDISSNKKITLILKNENMEKSLILDDSRLRYTNGKLDITIIEIKENKDQLKNQYLELDDSIINYLKLNKNEREQPNYLNNKYSNKSIYIMHYPEDKDVVVSYGPPPKLSQSNESEIRHKCSTNHGSSGSPILLINNQRLIGIHSGSYDHISFNKGVLLIHSLIEFEGIKNNLLLISKEGGYINNNDIIKNRSSYIIAEFDIEEDNKNTRIINSCENHFNKNLNKLENDKEIKEKCEIIVNGRIIPFSYYYKFDKKGKYKIIYNFKDKIKKLDYMFYNCSSLTTINFSNFYNNNITNMGYIFYNCSSLKNIDFTNLNTGNVTDMSCMFFNCSSLKNIDLSNFDTSNVTDMKEMFTGCSSLEKINLSNFNTNKVNDMSDMFFGCSNLTRKNIIVFDQKLLEELKNNY